MSQLDDLPADEHAVLSLVLRRGKSYGEIALALGIGEDEVRERAHGALEALAGRRAGDLSAAAREQIGDYLLAQQSASERLIAYDTLAGSGEARAFAQALARQLQGLAADGLPEIPGGANGDRTADPDWEPARAAPAPRAARGRRSQAPRRGAWDAEPTGAAPGAQEHSATGPKAPRLPAVPAAPADRPAAPVGSDRTRPPARARQRERRAAPRPPRSLPSSRRGGAVVLALLAAGAIAAIVLTVTSGPGGSNPARSASAARGSTAKPKLDSRLKLSAPAGSGSPASGEAAVIAAAGKRIIALEAKGLAPSQGQHFFYVVWLYNSPSQAYPVGKAPTVGSDGRMPASIGATPLPANAAAYHQLIVTRETQEHPASPGALVLSGPFKVN